MVQALKHVGVGPRTISSRPRPRIAGKKAIQVRAKRIFYPCLRSSRRGVAHAHIGLRYSLLWRRAHAAVLETEADDHERDSTEQTRRRPTAGMGRCSVDSCNLPRACDTHGTVASCSSDV